jgi:WD40 repeat protein
LVSTAGIELANQVAQPAVLTKFQFGIVAALITGTLLAGAGFVTWATRKPGNPSSPGQAAAAAGPVANPGTTPRPRARPPQDGRPREEHPRGLVLRVRANFGAGPYKHGGLVTCVAVSPDGRTLASGAAASGAAASGAVWLLDAGSGKVLFKLDTERTVLALAFSPDSTLVASAGQSGTIRLWDVATGQCRRTLSGHRGAVNALAFSSGGTLVSGGDDATARLWDVARGREKDRAEIKTENVLAVAFAADGKTVALGCQVRAGQGIRSQPLRLWNVETGVLTAMKLSFGAVKAVAFSRDGKLLASSSQDGSVLLWDVATRKLLRELKWVTRSGPFIMWHLHSLAFSPDGSLLAGTSNIRCVFVWRTDTGEQYQRWTGHDANRDPKSYAPPVQLGDRRSWPVTLGGITAATFMPNENILMTGGDDRYVRFWPVAKQR